MNRRELMIGAGALAVAGGVVGVLPKQQLHAFKCVDSWGNTEYSTGYSADAVYTICAPANKTVIYDVDGKRVTVKAGQSVRITADGELT